MQVVPRRTAPPAPAPYAAAEASFAETKVGIPEEVEHGIRRKWNIDSGGSGTAVPEVVNARR